jgi:hypothetical protein
MKLLGGAWSKGDVIAFLALVVAIVATALTVPESRRWIGLDKPDPRPKPGIQLECNNSVVVSDLLHEGGFIVNNHQVSAHTVQCRVHVFNRGKGELKNTKLSVYVASDHPEQITVGYYDHSRTLAVNEFVLFDHENIPPAQQSIREDWKYFAVYTKPECAEFRLHLYLDSDNFNHAEAYAQMAIKE